jgi:protein-S-isoprenylcysteine O-methyltransferase Ste14
MYREKEAKQKSIIKLANILFILGLTITGLDHRFGWSKVPLWLVIMSNVFILAGYYLIFLAFKENPFAARTIEVFKDQKVIDTGPYAIIRHPIYAGTIPMFLCIPLALGSFWAISVFISLCVIIILRTLNEEEVLNRDLPGYRAYCEKIRYRLVPLIW